MTDMPDVPREPDHAPETIERAAIWHNDRVYAVASMDHVDVYRSMQVSGVPLHRPGAETRGHVTSKGRFVTVAEAERFKS